MKEKFVSLKNWLIENVLTDTFWENDKIKLSLDDVLKYLDEREVKSTYVNVSKIKKLLIDIKRDKEKVQKSDLKYPLIVTQSKGKFIEILDGHHRLTKALTNDIDKIKIRILDLDTAPKEYKELFMRNIKKKNWSSETKKEKTYGCVMLFTKIDKWEEDHLEGINEKDVYEVKGDDSYGLEEEPHVTVLYGIHEDEIDPGVVRDVMEANMKPFSVTISEIGCFENEDYDVVFYKVPVVQELKKLRKLFSKTFANTQTCPDYKPHITISYVKKGEGKKYAKILEEPFQLFFVKGVYSWNEKNKQGEIEQIRKQYVFPKEEVDEVKQQINESSINNINPEKFVTRQIVDEIMGDSYGLESFFYEYKNEEGIEAESYEDLTEEQERDFRKYIEYNLE